MLTWLLSVLASSDPSQPLRLRLRSPSPTTSLDHANPRNHLRSRSRPAPLALVDRRYPVHTFLLSILSLCFRANLLSFYFSLLFIWSLSLPRLHLARSSPTASASLALARRTRSSFAKTLRPRSLFVYLNTRSACSTIYNLGLFVHLRSITAVLAPEAPVWTPRYVFLFLFSFFLLFFRWLICFVLSLLCPRSLRPRSPRFTPLASLATSLPARFARTAFVSTTEYSSRWDWDRPSKDQDQCKAKTKTECLKTKTETVLTNETETWPKTKNYNQNCVLRSKPRPPTHI